METILGFIIGSLIGIGWHFFVQHARKKLDIYE